MEREPEVESVLELDRRAGNGLEVILWWVHGTLETYVEVTDYTGNDHFILATPEGHSANEVFRHPFAYRATEEQAHGATA